MTDLRKAAEMALEALETRCTLQDRGMAVPKVGNAIEALRQALAQPDQYAPSKVSDSEYVKAQAEFNARSGTMMEAIAQPEPISNHIWMTREDLEKAYAQPEQSSSMDEWRSMVVVNLLRRCPNLSKHELRELAAHFQSRLPNAQPEQERNFCERCSKRLFFGHIHTCTPPIIDPSIFKEKNT